MKPANYAVVRYVADPARNEALNVGILAWDDGDYRLRIQEDAVARVVRDHPWLEKDALLYLEPLLSRQLSALKPYSPRAVQQFLEGQRGYPIALTEPRYTTLDEGQPDPLGTTVDRLVQRVVQPRRRTGGGGGVNPVAALEREFRAFISRHVMAKNHVFESSGTGIPRKVDFYANSGANVAIDTLRLAVQQGDQIRLRADAEANKINDIRSANEVRSFVVWCVLSAAPECQEANRSARQILERVGATVRTDLAETAAEVERIVGPVNPDEEQGFLLADQRPKLR